MNIPKDVFALLPQGRGESIILPSIVAVFTALSKYRLWGKKVSTLYDSVGKKTTGVPKVMGSTFQVFGPLEPLVPVTTGCTGAWRDLLTPVFSPRGTGLSIQRLADLEWQNNSIQLQGCGILAALQPSSEFGHNLHFGGIRKGKVALVSPNGQEGRLGETEF